MNSSHPKIRKSHRIIRLVLLLGVLICVTACMIRPSVIDQATSVAPAGRLQNASQMLLVADESFLFWTAYRVYALERTGLVWQEALKPIDAVVGRNGFAPPGEKREGDGRTPSGLYGLGTVFGYAETAATKMPYRQALADDLWIDDPDAPDYNRWVRRDETTARSYEKMRRDDDLYKYGMVIEYNTHPVVKDHGSAIFLHIWAGAWSTTAGCVAVSEENLLKILAWLSPEASPVIFLNPVSP